MHGEEQEWKMYREGGAEEDAETEHVTRLGTDMDKKGIPSTSLITSRNQKGTCVGAEDYPTAGYLHFSLSLNIGGNKVLGG